LEPAAYAIKESHIEPLAGSAINNPPDSPALGPNEVYFPPGQLLFNKGDSADNFYVIRRGDVSLFEPNSQKEIAVLPAGTSFGEQAILVGGVRSVSARSVDGVICLALSAKTLRDMLEIQEGSIKPVVEALLLQLYLRNDLQARGCTFSA
jgi:CRP-like cAMP-binding protein